MPRIFILTLLSVFLFFQSCNHSDNQEESALMEVPLELLDSLVIDVLEPLELDDYDPARGLYLLRGQSKAIYLVNEVGEVILKPDVLGMGPNQIGARNCLGCEFMGEDKIVCKSANMDYHIYDMQFQKIQKLPSTVVNLNFLNMQRNRLPFNTYEINGSSYIIGIEVNSYIPIDIPVEKIGTGFYDEAKVIFKYDLLSGELEFLDSYPDEWAPKRNKEWVGQSFPIIHYDRFNHLLGVLPKVGNQLFIYDNSSGTLNQIHNVELSHPERSGEYKTVELSSGFSTPYSTPGYPTFSDIRVFGDYQIVKFNTYVPEEVQNELKAENPNYLGSPKWGEAMKNYYRAYHIVIKDGKQLGIINKFPAYGVLDYVSPMGVIYLNDNNSAERERDYNVFYKVRMKD